MKPRKRKKKTKEILELLAVQRIQRGPGAPVDGHEILIYKIDKEEPETRAALLMEIVKAGLAEVHSDYHDEYQYPALMVCKNGWFSITDKGMAKIRPKDPLYSEYAVKSEKSPGILHRIVHEWLREIIIGVILLGIGAFVSWYLTKP